MVRLYSNQLRRRRGYNETADDPPCRLAVTGVIRRITFARCEGCPNCPNCPAPAGCRHWSACAEAEAWNCQGCNHYRASLGLNSIQSVALAVLKPVKAVTLDIAIVPPAGIIIARRSTKRRRIGRVPSGGQHNIADRKPGSA